VGDSEDLDFVLVAVAPMSENRVPLSSWGHLQLDGRPGKVSEGEFITVIQVRRLAVLCQFKHCDAIYALVMVSLLRLPQRWEPQRVTECCTAMHCFQYHRRTWGVVSAC
jgi:hypothetical protein